MFIQSLPVVILFDNCTFYDIFLSSLSIYLSEPRLVVTFNLGVAKQSGHMTKCLQWLCFLNLGSWEAVWLENDP